MKILIIFCLVAWSIAARCQTLDPRTIDFLRTASTAHSEHDLVQSAAANATASREGIFWRDAIAISDADIGGEPAGRASIVRLMAVELLDEGRTATAEDLDQLNGEDISALKEMMDIPEPTDLLYYLLERGPSLRDVFTGGEYLAVRVPQTDRHILFERSTTPYLGLKLTFLKRDLPPAQDPVSVPAGERAKTRRIGLAALPEITLAAKALRVSSILSAQRKAFATYIAYNAMRRAFAVDPRSFRVAVWRLAVLSLRQAEEDSTDPLLHNLATRLKFQIPATSFFAREFTEAEKAYRAMGESAGDPSRTRWAAWGEALSTFASGRTATSAFARLVGLLSSKDPIYSYMVMLLLENLPVNERNSLGDSAAWLAAAKASLEHAELTSNLTVSWDFDFLNLADTIGRPDIAVSFLLTKLDSVRGTTLEKRYLVELGAFTRDLYYFISFQMSPNSDWTPRPVTGYPMNSDFLHDVFADGRLVGPGEVVLLNDDTAIPYAKTNPEADAATAFSVYGVISTTAAAVTPLLPATPPDQRAKMVAGFERWARESAERTSPAPSVVPYLKLVWLEWFSEAFEPLKLASVQPSEYVYSPIDASPLTKPKLVAELVDNSNITEHQKAIIRVFIDIRKYLERHYPVR